LHYTYLFVDTPGGHFLAMLEAENTAAFQKFTQLCENHGLLSKPRGLGPEDVCDGFSDEATLL
jgi:hypothetical protein